MASEILEILKENGKKIDYTTNKLEMLATLFNTSESKLKTKYGGFSYADSIEASTVFQTRDTTVTLGIWKKAQTVYPLHCHKDSIEYLVIIRGSFIVKFGGSMRAVSRGECISVPIGMEHTVTSLEDDSQILAVCVPPEEAYQ